MSRLDRDIIIENIKTIREADNLSKLTFEASLHDKKLTNGQ